MTQENPQAPVPTYVAAFRATAWDPSIAGLAARMEAYCQHGRFVVLADETAGPLDVAPFQKLVHRAELTAPALPGDPPPPAAGFADDDALYDLMHQLPPHDYYVMIDCDVQVNADLDQLVATVAERGVDLVAPELRQPGPDWGWYGSVAAHFATPWAILSSAIVVSRRALEVLHAARKAHAARWRSEGAGWAHSEGFMPSVLADTPGMRMADLTEFVRLPHFSWYHSLLAGSPETEVPGTMIRRVLGRDRYIARLFSQLPAADYLNPESHLRQLMAGFSLSDVLPHLRLALSRDGDAATIARLHAMLRLQPWDGGEDAEREARDIARGKPCLQSSIAPQWSRGTTVEEDAGYVVSPELFPDHAHHTETEDAPWWQVDLGAPHVIREVEVLNRTLEVVQARLNAYFLYGSLDGTSWDCLHFRPYGLPVSGNAERPERIEMDHLPVARFVRLQLPERGLLNLRRVRIWGDPAPGEAAGAA